MFIQRRRLGSLLTVFAFANLLIAGNCSEDPEPPPELFIASISSCQDPNTFEVYVDPHGRTNCDVQVLLDGAGASLERTTILTRELVTGRVVARAEPDKFSPGLYKVALSCGIPNQWQYIGTINLPCVPGPLSNDAGGPVTDGGGPSVDSGGPSGPRDPLGGTLRLELLTAGNPKAQVFANFYAPKTPAEE